MGLVVFFEWSHDGAHLKFLFLTSEKSFTPAEKYGEIAGIDASLFQQIHRFSLQ